MQRCAPSNFGMSRARRFAVAQARWRGAARIVTSRWDDFLRSEVDTGVFAFAAYLAALDADEAVAAHMSRLLAFTARHRTAG